MDIFGIGILEIFFIVLIALIILGPKDMVKAGRSMGRFIRKIFLTPGFIEAQRWVRNFPAQLIREAGIEEIQKDLKKEAEIIKKEAETIKEAATVSLEGNQPLISGTIAKPTPLTPVQEVDIMEVEESDDEDLEATFTASEALAPEQMYIEKDIPLEWINEPVMRMSRRKIDSPDGFPEEWITPPKSAATHPPYQSSPISPTPSATDGNKSEQE